MMESRGESDLVPCTRPGDVDSLTGLSKEKTWEDGNEGGHVGEERTWRG